MPIKSIKTESTTVKIGLIAGCLLCLIVTFFFVKWCLANTISSRASYKEVARLAADWSPSDPRTHYTLGVLSERTFLPEDLKESLAEFEKATALSPNDYRLWINLGKSRQLNGDSDGAKLAYQKAIELAPNYSENHWTYGNFLLKQGQEKEAFAELRKAAEKNNKYFSSIVSVAWQFFGGDVNRIKQNIGDSVNTNAELASYLARQNRLDEALQIYNALPADAKKTTFKANAADIFAQMLVAKKYAAALQIYNQISAPGAENFKVGEIFNGGFEKEVKSTNADAFDWQIAEGREPQIGVDDSQKSSGNRSLVLVFNSATGRDFRNVQQTVVVEPEKTYNFGMFYKSDLETAATFKWEIISATDGKVLAATEAVAAKKDWTNQTIQFTADKDTDAVIIALAREVCTSNLCPVSGKIRFDDFSLE